MEIFTARHLTQAEFIVYYVLQLCTLIGLMVLAFWLWPDGLTDKPISEISLEDCTWGALAVLVGIFTALVGSFVLIETAIALAKSRSSGGKE